MNTDPILEVNDVSKRFARGLHQSLRYAGQDILRQLFLPWRPVSPDLRPGEFWAVRNVSFSLKRGESLGILGDNGAGKSTLLRLITGIFTPTAGAIRVDGRVGAIVELGSAFAPNMSGRENLSAQALMHGYSPELLRRQFDRIVEFADVGEFIDSPVRHYSTGMRARLGFAVAAHCEPDLLVVDEVLAVGDLGFQNKCLRFVEDFRARGGAVVFVGHNPVQMQAACERGIVLERGQVTFEGTIVDAIDQVFNSAESKAMDDSPPPAASDSAEALNGSPGRGRVDVLATGMSHDPPRHDEARGSLTVDLTVAVLEVAPELKVVVTFFSPSSSNALAVAFADAPALPPGLHQVTVLFPSLPLLPGDYLVKLALLAGAAPYPLWTQGWMHDAPRPLRIHGDPTPFANMARLISAKIGLNCDLTTRAIERSAENGLTCSAVGGREIGT